ncbi:hypothetical protein JCM8547_009110 [Rhodosporidiobolus lusitaniae]
MAAPSPSLQLPSSAADGYLSPSWVVPPDWPLPPSHSMPSLSSSSRRDSISSVSSSSSSTASSSSTSSWDSEAAEREAQLQWEESLRQLNALVNLVAVPWISRYFGRKWAYWLFERYLDIGIGKRFFLGPLSTYAPAAWR